jgi:membrane protease YdiL (CAAX protease family)
LAPFSEELFFRGILTRLLLRYWSVVIVVPLVAMLFAAAHFEWRIGPLLLGLATTALYAWRRSLWPGIVLHAIANAFGPLLFYLAPETYSWLRPFFS